MANTPDVRVRVSGEDAGVAALLTRVVKQLDVLSKRQDSVASSTAKAGAAQRNAARDTSTLAAAQDAGASAATKLATRLIGLVAAYAGIRQAIGAVSRGLDLNATLESTQLGIASLIASQGGLTDATGKTLSATEALNASQGIAAEQLQKLRVAGLETTATFEQLSQAFQTAVGPGLAAGLTLDQIRQVTVSATQAAAALNVPMNQLDQEIRSILDGTIDVNSRVAKTLQITSAQVKLERERGTLFDFLNQKLATFNAAGEKAAQTFAGMASNAKEGVDLFLQTVTQPFFEKLKKAGNDALKGVFDLKAATLAPAFDGIVAFAQRAFSGLGDLLGKAIAGAVEGAQRLSEFLRDNHEAVTAFAHDVAGAAAQLGRVVVEAVKLTAEIVKAAAQSGAISAALNLVEGAARAAAGVLRFVRDHIEAIAVVLTGAAFVAGVANLAAIDLAIAGFASSIAAAPFAAAALALAGIVTVTNAIAVAQERAAEATARQNGELLNATRYAPPLIAEFQKLAKQIDDGALKGDKLKAAQDRVAEIKRQLIQLSPEFQRAFGDESDSMRTQADQAEALADKLRDVKALKLDNLKADLVALRQQERDLANQAPPSTDAQFVAQNARLKKLRESIAATEKQLADLGETAGKPIKLPGVVVTGAGDPKLNPPKPAGDPKAALNDLKSITDAAIQEQQRQLAAFKADLDRQLASNLVSWADYFRQLDQKTNEAADAQAAALRKLLTATTDKGDRAKLLAQITDVERTRTSAIEENGQRRLELEKGLSKQVIDLGVQQLREEGRLADARKLELTESFRDLRARLVLENRKGAVEIIDALIDVGTARTRIEEIEAVLARAAGERGQAESSAQTRVQAGVITERQAREELLAVYRRQKAAIEAQLPLLAQQAAITKAAVDVTALQQYAAELENVNLLIEQTGNSWGRARKDIVDAVQGDLADFLGNTISTVQNLREAFTSLATSIVGSIQRIVGGIIAQKLVDAVQKLLGIGNESSAAKIGQAARELTVAGVTVAGAAAAMLAAAIALRAAGGAGGGGGGDIVNHAVNAAIAAGVKGLGFASGGYTGAGGKYEPAGVVHRGEYVIPAHRVRQIGISHLDALAGLRTPRVRRLRAPRRGYADGGLVTASVPVTGGGTISGTLHLEVDEGVIVRAARAHLESPDGQRQVLDVAVKHKGKLSQIVRSAS